MTFWGFTFKNVKRSERKISGSVLKGHFIWSFRLHNNTDLKLSVRISPTSHYDAITGSSRTNWGHTCNLRSKEIFQKFTLLSSPTGNIIFKTKFGHIRIINENAWFDRILDDVRAVEQVSFGILAFEKRPEENHFDEDAFILHNVDGKVTLYDNRLQLNMNINKAIKYLPYRQWYVFYIKTSGGNSGWMRLRRRNR